VEPRSDWDPFTLTDHQGVRRSSTELIDKLLVIYFGYRHRPEICPLDLMEQAQRPSP
jgi:protein SCO1/2